VTQQVSSTNVATPEFRAKRPLSAVVDDIFQNMEEIVRSELQLARTEAAGEARKAARKASPLAIAAVLGWYAGGLLLLSAVFGLASVVPLWLASLVIGVAILLVAIGLYAKGREQLKEVEPELPATSQSLTENLAWIKKQSV